MTCGLAWAGVRLRLMLTCWLRQFVDTPVRDQTSFLGIEARFLRTSPRLVRGTVLRATPNRAATSATVSPALITASTA
jgi:hypothetical protein